MAAFSETLKTLMQERHISRTALAKATGVSPTAVGHWVTGNGKPSHDRMVRIAEFLGVKLSTLIDAAADHPKPPTPQMSMPAQAEFGGEVIEQDQALKLSPAEQSLIRVWRLLNPDEKRMLLRAAGVDFSILSRLFDTTA